MGGMWCASYVTSAQARDHQWQNAIQEDDIEYFRISAVVASQSCVHNTTEWLFVARNRVIGPVMFVCTFVCLCVGG
eukprot:m.36208 g.36208  ORF g.36208 m.36208 type:complete len:76 (-) comp14466_c0_seq1:99-326(-)